MSSVGVTQGLIEDEISFWSRKLEDCKKYLSDLQEERKDLIQKRLSLQKIVGQEISVFEYFRDKPDIDTQDNRKIFQLVTDIHNLELKSLELDEKLKIVEIEKEVKGILRSFQPVEESASFLGTWYRELKCLQPVCTDECSVDHINYHSEKQRHYLKFNLLHKGVALLIQILEYVHKESGAPVVKVTSDIYIEDMEEKVSEMLKKKEPFDNVLVFLKNGVEEDILPFLNNEVNKDDMDDEAMNYVEESD